jgi:superoxide dismutase, Cu-Zn family
MKLLKISFIVAVALLSRIASADTLVNMQATSNDESIGTITIQESPKGLVLIPHLHGLPPGPHGFHIHQMPTCENHGEAAGGHLDPNHTGKHLGSYGNGHLGDLPVLEVAKDGTATKPVVAPRLKMNDVYGHSLMIHQGGDNYSDVPKKLGGGGARIACGAIPSGK